MVIHRFLGLLGENIAHSLSPLMHNTWMTSYGIEAQYSLLGSNYSLESLGAEGIFGANVTIPFKKKWVEEVLIVDEGTRMAGALNTLWQNNGVWHGQNTDIVAFENLVPSADCALVFGSGGAALASVVALKKLGYSQIYVVSRSVWDRLDLTPLWHDFALATWKEMVKIADTVVNALPLRDWGAQITPMMRKESVFVDWVYVGHGQNPLLYAPHIEVVGGNELLIEQARYSFQTWFGILPNPDMVRIFYTNSQKY